jgi:formylmethanofuran dehydrogenase subunit B
VIDPPAIYLFPYLRLREEVNGVAGRTTALLTASATLALIGAMEPSATLQETGNRPGRRCP